MSAYRAKARRPRRGQRVLVNGRSEESAHHVRLYRRHLTYYVLFFIHLESRRVAIAGITVHPNEAWIKQIARNVTMDGDGTLRDCCYLLYDRDAKFTRSFRSIIASGRVKPLALPARSPNLNAYGELLKLGIEVAQSTVAKYMARSGRGRSQTWKTFLHNHAAGIGAMDFLIVPTVGFRLLFVLVILGTSGGG